MSILWIGTLGELEMYENYEKSPLEKVETDDKIRNFKNQIKDLQIEIEYLKERIIKIEKKLEDEVIATPDLSDEVIEKIIKDYLEKHQEKKVYPSDIAFAFNLDAKKVFDICCRLEKENKLG